MDFITKLLKVQSKDCIFVVVNRLTKFVHLFSMATDYSAVLVADLFFREVFILHGLLRTIVNDHGSRFLSGL